MSDRDVPPPGNTTSPLLDEHRALGATFTDFAGWQMPVKYGSELAEHHAVRTAAGLFDISHMGEITVRGPGAAAALDHALVGEFSKIAVGKAKYSLMCNRHGGVIDDLITYRIAEDDFLVVANAANVGTVSAELATRSSDHDATVTDRSAEISLIAVQGPVAEDIITSVVAETLSLSVSSLKYYAAIPSKIADIDVLLARTGYTGEDGFELYAPRNHAVDLWRLLITATAAHGGSPAGLACRDTLRLEAGMPLYGHELTLETNPFQAGLGHAVRLNRPFVGREALEQISATPQLRRLTALRGSGKRAARAGYAVLSADNRRRVGTVTSGALSPTLGYPIALAYIDSALAESGTELYVDIRGRHEPFQITASPFYRRS